MPVFGRFEGGDEVVGGLGTLAQRSFMTFHSHSVMAGMDLDEARINGVETTDLWVVTTRVGNAAQSKSRNWIYPARQTQV